MHTKAAMELSPFQKKRGRSFEMSFDELELRLRDISF